MEDEMKPDGFCKLCGWMRLRCNPVYVMHTLRCRIEFSSSSMLLVLVILLAALALGQATSNSFHPTRNQSIAKPFIESGVAPIATPSDSAIRVMDSLLKKYEVADYRRTRIAEAIIRSSRKHNLDPRLIASIVIVESRANPFAISAKDAVGIMQIHVPTWERVVDHESINLFKIEDNVDFGVRILKDYVNRYGLDEGIKRYNGWDANRPETTPTAEAYLQKVYRILGSARTEPANLRF
jgi:soluble lytic murein transglycosylase-like protein